MKLLSVNVGRPRPVEWNGKTVLTSIYKTPVAGKVRVGTLNIEGDQQSDLTVHGGVEKAVYAYPSEHYAFWRKELEDGHNELAGAEMPWGAFGENLTTQGLIENAVPIGGRFRIGTAEFQVTEPREPCFKLGIRSGRPDIIERFQHSGRSGFYLAVVKEGVIAAGDAIEWLPPVPDGSAQQAITIADIASLANAELPDPELLRRAAALPALPAGWREYMRQRLADQNRTY